MLISFIIPMYNAERHIKQCLESIIMQTVKDYEVILVNDGSTDKTEEICNIYIKQDSRFCLIQQANGGPSAARNRGLSVAHGEWIWFVDADDWLERNAVEILRETIKQEQADMISFDFIQEEPNNKKIIKNGMYGSVGHKKFCKIVMEQSFHFGLNWSNIFSKKFLEDNKLCYDETLSLCEDCEFMLRISACVNQVCLIQQTLYHYRISLTSLSKAYHKDIASRYVTTGKKLYAFVVQNHNNEMEASYDLLMQRMLIWIALYDVFHPSNPMSYITKKKKMNALLQEKIFVRALQRRMKEDMGMAKKITIFCIRHHLYPIVAGIARIRYYLITQKEKGVYANEGGQ